MSCIKDDHHFTNTTDDTCAAALQGGCDLDCGGLLSQCAEAVTKKTRGLDEDDVDTALVRIFSQRIATGEFEPDANDVSYRKLGLEHFNTTAAQTLALETARQSMVLMKNDASALPIELQSVVSNTETHEDAVTQLNMVVAGKVECVHQPLVEQHRSWMYLRFISGG